MRKRDLTTGECAKVLGVAPRTVSKWFESGHLKGYKLPGSLDRRIPYSSLVKFVSKNGLPAEFLDAASYIILVATADDQLVAALKSKLNADVGWVVRQARDELEAGMVVSSTPVAAVVDCNLLGVAASIALAKRLMEKGLPWVAMLACEDTADFAPLEAACHTLYKRPFDFAQLVEHIECRWHYGTRRDPMCTTKAIRERRVGRKNADVLAGSRFQNFGRRAGRQEAGEAEGGGAPAAAQRDGFPPCEPPGLQDVG